MPQYYSGVNAATSFSDGLMAGYEFVDRIRARRRQLELQERQMAMQEERHGLDMATGRYNLERARVEDTYEDENQDFLRQERTRAQRVREETEAARELEAEAILTGSRPRFSLGAIGAAPAAARPTATPQPVGAATLAPASARSAAPASAPGEAPAATAGPVDLRAAQRERDEAPGFVDRVRNFVADNFKATRQKQETQDVQTFWKFFADPNMPLGYHRDHGKGIDLNAARRDPASFAFSYIKDRSRVPADVRGTLDLTMTSALKDRADELASQIQALDPADQRNAPRIKALTDRLIEANVNLDNLSKEITKSVATDAGITRPVKVTDERIVPAVVDAAARSREVTPIPVATEAELRAAGTMAARLTGAQRVNPKQLEAITTLYKYGAITREELVNWSKYGTPIAPKPPSVHAIGNGTAVVVTEDGLSFIQAPGSAGAGGMKDTEVRLRQKENMQTMYNGIVGAIESGQLKGDPKRHFMEMLSVLGRSAAQVESRSGVQLIDPKDNAVRFHMISPTEAAELVKGYVRFHKGEVDTPWYGVLGRAIFGGESKPYEQYLPESLGSEPIEDWTQGVF